MISIEQKHFQVLELVFLNLKDLILKMVCQAWNVVNLRILGWVNENKKSVDIQTTSEASSMGL